MASAKLKRRLKFAVGLSTIIEGSTLAVEQVICSMPLQEIDKAWASSALSMGVIIAVFCLGLYELNIIANLPDD